MKNNRKILIGLLCFSMLLVPIGCGKSVDSTQGKLSLTNEITIVSSDKEYEGARIIELQEDKAILDGVELQEFDYTWNCDPTVFHDEVEYAPAEFYTGTKPDSEIGLYVDHELYYFPLLDEKDFVKVKYDGDKEWAYYYKDGKNENYIFATLPALGEKFPVQMMHSAEEAGENKVLHITESGIYVLRGSWKGQIKIDLGEDAYLSEEAKVNLILDGADIECSVAPAIIFERVYECDNSWESEERNNPTVDTDGAGANIIIADDSKNYLLGNNVFRMLKTKFKDENSKDEVKTQKKMRKLDGTLFSFMSMNIGGEEKQNGLLTIDSGYEGISSELHLSVNGGTVVINSQDDGVNANEDHASVIAFRGGDVTINAGLGSEGDGADSNGYIVVDGGTVRVNGIRVPDSALDSEDGVYYYSGKIIIDGQEQNYEAGDVFKETGKDGMHFDGGDKPLTPPPMERPLPPGDYQTINELINKVISEEDNEQPATLPHMDYEEIENIDKDMGPTVVKEAKEKGFVIVKNCRSVEDNREIWDSFLKKVEDGKPATVCIGYLYTKEGNNMISQVAEVSKEDFDSFFMEELTYDGQQFSLAPVNRIDGVFAQCEIPGYNSPTETYPYLMHFRGVDRVDSTIMYDKYVLTNKTDITWDDLDLAALLCLQDEDMFHMDIISEYFSTNSFQERE